MESHYEALGLSPTADEQAVRRAYRELLKEHHPDQGGSRDQFLRITEAYEQIVGDRPPTHETGHNALSQRGPTRQPVHPTYDPDEQTDSNGADHKCLTVSGQYLTLTLSALVQNVSLDRLVDGPVPAATERTVAFFRVQNTSSQALSWQGKANTGFIADDGFLYQGSSIVQPHAESLPARWSGTDVEIQPGRALDAVVIAQEIPADATVEKVVYTQHGSEQEGAADDTERYLFELRPLVRERLNRLPFRD